MSELFSPSTPLETLVHRGDHQGVIEYLRPLSLLERQRHRASIARMIRLMWESGWRSPSDKGLIWDSRSTADQDRAAAVAILLCGTAKDAAEARLKAADIVSLSREFDLPCLPDLADELLKRWPGMIGLVQELIVSGVIERPDSEAYTIGLIALPRNRDGGKRIADFFSADPGLTDAVLRMFDIQGTAEDSLASSDKYNSADNSWLKQILSLSASGALARSTLLDKTLGALEQDWPQYRSGWFSRFHKEMAPTVDELHVNLQRYLQLCHSRIPPTVSLALDALAALESDGRGDPADVIEALRPVFAGGSKGQVETALKLLERCIKRAPALGAEAAQIACAALVQELPALQAKIIKLAARFADDARVREALRAHLPGLAASNRGAVHELLGVEDADSRRPDAERPSGAASEPAALTAPERRLDPVRDGTDLVQLIAYVFENDTDIDAFERALSALVESAPIAQAELPQFGPVLKRVPKLRTPIASELGRLLVFACQGVRLPAATTTPNHGPPKRIQRLLMARVDQLMDLVAQAKRVPPLSAPSHRRGVISATHLISRWQLYCERGATTSLDEQVLALLRLDPMAANEDRLRLRGMPDSPFVRAFRYAVGDDIIPGKQRELFCAAARIRHPGLDDPILLNRYGDLGPDGPAAAQYSWSVISWRSEGPPAYEFHGLSVLPVVSQSGNLEFTAIARHPPPLGKDSWAVASRSPLAGHHPALVAYSSTLLPSDMEAFFAEGARELGNNLDWYEARWQNKAYLEPLLDASVRVGPMAVLMLACALAGKEPGQTALAVDCLVKLHAEGRLDTDLLANTMAQLLATQLVKAARYRKSFDAALRIDPGLSETFVDLLLHVLIANAGSPPKEAAKLLELLHELLIAGGRSLSEAESVGLAAMKLGGSGKSIQKRLLALQG